MLSKLSPEMTEVNSLVNTGSSSALVWHSPGIKAFLEKPSSAGLFHRLLFSLFPTSTFTHHLFIIFQHSSDSKKARKLSLFNGSEHIVRKPK